MDSERGSEHPAAVQPEDLGRFVVDGSTREPDLQQAPGLVILDERLAVESATPTSPGWLADLSGTIETPPASVLVVAGQVLSGSGGPAESRVRAGDGRWLVLHGSCLARRDGRRQVSVVIEAAQPVHLTSLLMRVYGLTSREQLGSAALWET